MSTPAASARSRRARGFTMIELLIAIVILGILGAIGVPAFNEASLSNKLSAYANSFNASLKIARSEAIKRNATVTMCRSADGATCAGSGTWQQGWMVFRDADSDGVLDATETRFAYEPAMSADYSLTSGGGTYTLNFQGSGMTATSQTLTLCRATPSPGSQKRTITVDATGRASVTRVSNATTCP